LEEIYLLEKPRKPHVLQELKANQGGHRDVDFKQLLRSLRQETAESDDLLEPSDSAERMVDARSLDADSLVPMLGIDPAMMNPAYITQTHLRTLTEIPEFGSLLLGTWFCTRPDRPRHTEYNERAIPGLYSIVHACCMRNLSF